MKFIILLSVLILTNITLINSRSFELEFDYKDNFNIKYINLIQDTVYFVGHYLYDNTPESDNFVAKFNMSGEKYFYNMYYHNNTDHCNTASMDDNYIYVLNDWVPKTASYGFDDFVINKFDLNGNLLTNTSYGEFNLDEMTPDILIKENKLYTAGCNQQNTYLSCVDKETLNQLWIKTYQNIPSYRLNGLKIFDDELIASGYGVYNQPELSIIKFDLNGEFLSGKKIKIKNNSKHLFLTTGIKQNENYIMVVNEIEKITDKFYLIKYDNELNLIESIQLKIPSKGSLNKDLVHYDDKFYFTYILEGSTCLITLDKDLSIEKEEVYSSSLKLLNIINGYRIFLNNKSPRSKLIFEDDNCFNEISSNKIIITNAELTESSINNVTYNEGLTNNKINYTESDVASDFINIPCSTPCGDGSEFDSKVSSLDKFELNGAKLTEIDSYLMTDEKNYFSHGALSHIDPVYVSAGFNSEFAFKIDKGYNDFIDGSLPGADGFSLIFHTDNQHLNFKSDQYGGGMGFHNRKNAVALEIDLYNNDEYNDPDGNHIAFQVPKDGILEAIHSDENTLALNSNIPLMNSDGKETYYCKLEYKDNNLKVWLDNSQDYGDPTLDIPNFKFSDYLSLIEHSKVYITLAAVTGTSYQKQEVLFWNWCSYYDPISSVEDNIQKDIISIFPNPSSDMIYIDGINNQTNIELFELTGRLILQQYYNNGINISELNRGIYILKLNNQNYKIIKE